MTAGVRIDKKALIRLLLVTIVLWIIWLPIVTSGNIRMDSDRMFHTPDAAFTQYIQEGRPALVWLLRLFGLSAWNPGLSGILFLVFFSISCWMLYFALRRLTGWNGLYPELFLLLYGLSPIWAYHGYFVLQISAIGFGIMLSTLMACTDVYFVRQNSFRAVRLLWEVTAVIILSFILLVYQSLIMSWLAALLTLLFCFLLKGGRISWKTLIPFILRLAVSMAAYYFISRMFRGNMGAGNMENQIHWGKDSFIYCLFRMAEEAGATLLMYTSRYFSLYTLGAILIILYLVRRRKAGDSLDPWLLLVGLGMLLLPFALTVLLGNVTVPRSQFTLQMVAAFFPVCYLAETKGKHRVLCFICAAAVILQAGLALRLYHTDEVRARQDTTAAETITAELSDLDTSKPLAFIGVRKMDGHSLLTEKSDVYGRTFFEWIYSPDQPTSATPPALRLLTAYNGIQYKEITGAEAKSKAADTAKEMPSYPSPGFIREEADMIVIKLSDP